MVKIKKIRLSDHYGTSQYIGDWIFAYGFYNCSLYSFSGIAKKDEDFGRISKINREIIYGEERKISGDSVYKYNSRFFNDKNK